VTQLNVNYLSFLVYTDLDVDSKWYDSIEDI